MKQRARRAVGTARQACARILIVAQVGVAQKVTCPLRNVGRIRWQLVLGTLLAGRVLRGGDAITTSQCLPERTGGSTGQANRAVHRLVRATIARPVTGYAGGGIGIDCVRRDARTEGVQ